LINYNFQGYLEEFRVDHYNNRGAYNVDNELYIGRGRLTLIATKFEKVIICFESGTVFVRKSEKRKLMRRAVIFFPDMNNNFYVIERAFKYSINIIFILMILFKKVVR
jgi:hypothetical protein